MTSTPPARRTPQTNKDPKLKAFLSAFNALFDNTKDNDDCDDDGSADGHDADNVTLDKYVYNFLAKVGCLKD